MPDLYIIKLGGSVITNKEGNKFEVRHETLQRIAQEIRQAKGECGFSLAVIHGAGPFGHTNVKEYGINNGVFDEKQEEGYKKTVKDCNRLDSQVAKALKKAGLKPKAFDPNKLITQDNKKIVDFPTSEIEAAISQGLVPVLYGQMVKDKTLNYSVISGDTIIGHLAKKLGAKKVFLGTDVAGLYTTDPKKDPSARQIPLINKDNFENVLEKASEARTVDVTGGMKGKLEKLRQTLKGTTALIFNANETGSFYKALKGQEVKGTRVVL